MECAFLSIHFIVVAIASAIVVVDVVFTVVVALERVGSASHWTRETRTTDSLRYAIAGVVVVVMVTHYPFFYLSLSLSLSV